MDIWTGHLDGTCPGHVQDIEIFLGHCPIPALPTTAPATVPGPAPPNSLTQNRAATINVYNIFNN